jgi:MoxR-like ATPase
MDIKSFKQQLPLLFKHKVTPLVIGKHGIGKSSIVEQFCADNGYKCVIQNLGTKEAGDIQGLLDTRDGTSSFLPPVFVKEINVWAKANPDKYAVVFLDEINHIHKDMQAVLFSCLLGNRIGDVQMESNVRYVAAMNPPSKDYPGVFDFRNLALVDRFCHIELLPKVEEWVAYAKTTGIDPEWIEFYQSTPNFLDPVGEAYNVHKNIKGSRRSAILAAKLAADGALDETLEGIIGSAALQSFLVFKKKRDEESLQVTNIIGRKSLTKATKATIEKWNKEEQYGKIQILCESIKSHFAGMEKDAATQQDADRIQDLFELLPIDKAYELALVLMRDTVSINMKFDQSVNKRSFDFWDNAVKSGKVVPDVK